MQKIWLWWCAAEEHNVCIVGLCELTRTGGEYLFLDASFKK